MITVRIIRGMSAAILAAALIVAPLSTALAAPPWEDLFFNPCPETRGAWTFSTEKLNMDKYIPGGYGFIPGDVGNLQTEGGAWRSRGANQSRKSWTGAYVGGESGEAYRVISAFSFGNDISTWLAPPEGMTRNIKYSILQQYLPDLNNADILEIDENQIEMMRIRGAQTDPPSGNLGIVDPYKGADRNVTGFDFNAGLAPDRFRYNHFQALSSDFDNPYIMQPVSDQTAENIYCSLGKTGKFNPDGTLRYGAHAYMHSLGGERRWGVENGSGFSAPGEGAFDQKGDISGEYFNASGISINPSNGRWWGDIVIGGTTYTMYLEDTDGSIKPYESGKYPQDPENPGDPDAASGYPVRWHDDYELQENHPGLDLGVTTYGENGRYIAERSENAFWETYQAEVHEADVLAEVRTYDPYGNSDGPTSPYEWVFDSSGDMYEPSAGFTPRPDITDPVRRRAVELIGHHPAFPDDDTPDEIEHNEGKDGTDWKIGANWENGVVERTVFEHAVRLAELMLYPDGQRPFEDLGYVWDTEAGCVAEESLKEDDFLSLGNPLKLPDLDWDPVMEAWVFPDVSWDTGWFEVWGFIDHPEYTPVAGYEALNDFMRYVFDIDAVVVQDIDGDGHFDEGVDYILFSVRDDGLFTKMLGWDNNASAYGIIYDTPFEGQFFDGDTIFLYDGLNVITYFDPGSDVFFGEKIIPLETTFWKSGGGFPYDLDGLDIGLVPEPGSILLIVGAGFGLAAGLIRRKHR